MRRKATTTYSTRFQNWAAALVLALGAATSTLFTQVQQCSVFNLNPPSAVISAAGGTGSVTCDKGNVTNGVYIGCAWTATSNATWIVINSGANSSQSGVGVVHYTVQANTTAVTRTGTVTFSSGSYQNATYTITQAGSSNPSSPSPFAVTPAALYFYYQPGQAIPATQTLNVVSNVSGGSAFSAFAITNSPAAWLGVTPDSGNASASGTTVTITLNGDALVGHGSLTRGAYTGEVVISSSGSGTVTVPVTLIVNNTPVQPLIVPASLQFQYDPNHPESPPTPQPLAITSNNGATNFTVSSVALTPPPPPNCPPTVSCVGNGWLSLGTGNSRIGSLVNGGGAIGLAGPLTTPATIIVSLSPTGLNLPPGRYTTAVQYTVSTPNYTYIGSVGDAPTPKAETSRDASAGGCNAQQAQTNITLTVGSVPLQPNPQTISFDDTIQSQPVTVLQLSGLQQLALLPPAISTCPGGWITISPAGRSNTGSPYYVSQSATDPLQGPYNGTITFTDTTGLNSTGILVSATPGSRACGWSSDQGSLAFTFDGSNFPQALTANILNSCVNTAAVTATSDFGWLSVPNAIQVPGPLAVSVIPSVLQTLAAGSYAGSVTVSQFSANVPPLSISVSLTVTQPFVAPVVSGP